MQAKNVTRSEIISVDCDKKNQNIHRPKLDRSLPTKINSGTILF